MTARRNRRILLAARPPGVPRESDFELIDAPMPEPGPGEVLVRGIYLSLDPYMRGRMRDAKSYTPPTALGDVMPGHHERRATQPGALEGRPPGRISRPLGASEMLADGDAIAGASPPAEEAGQAIVRDTEL